MDRPLSKIQSVVRSLMGRGGDGAARAAAPPDERAIQDWLVSKLSEKLGLEPEAIDIGATFASFGLDSRAAIRISGDLERWLGCQLPPTLVWDYPTIESAARFLAGVSEGPRPGADATHA